MADEFALDLAADRLGQLVHVLHDAGVLVGCRRALDVVLQLARELVGGRVALGQDDGRLDHVAADALGVGCGGDGALDDRGMRDQRALDLEGADAVARALDHVVVAAHEAVVAVAVAPGHVVQVVVVAADRLGRLVRVVAIAHEESGRVGALELRDADRALLAVLHLASVVVEQLDVAERVGLAHGAGMRLDPGEVGDQHRALALAEALADALAREPLPADGDVGVERLAGRREVGDRREVVLLDVLLEHEAVHGRRRAEGAQIEVLHHSKSCITCRSLAGMNFRMS